MQTGAATLGAVGAAALFLGYIEVLGSAGALVHLGLLLLGAAGLLGWGFALAGAPSRWASAVLLLLSVGGVTGLAALAVHLRPQGLPYALLAAPLLLAATGAGFFRGRRQAGGRSGRRR